MKENRNVRCYCRLLGYRAIADAFGVSIKTVYDCADKNRFPASWYEGIQELGREQSPAVEIPSQCFGFKPIKPMADRAA